MELSEHLITGIDIIDQQHKNFLKMIEDLEERVEISPSRSEVESAISFIETYANKHFQSEEKVMHLIDYDRSFEHINDHKQFYKYLE
ncbi:MAG: hypothetical protein C0614_14305, partial [Desulfuromonas sp.]